jgi:hypothetical protein
MVVLPLWLLATVLGFISWGYYTLGYLDGRNSRLFDWKLLTFVSVVALVIAVIGE